MPDLWPDQHPLDGPVWKINWSRTHIKAIDDLVRFWHSLDANDVRYDLNAERTLWEYRVGAIVPPPINISMHVGEFAYQLRSALDQIIYGLSTFPPDLPHHDREAAESTTAFPILREANDKQISGRLKFVLEEVRPQVQAAVESVQPYKSQDIFRDELMLLDRINIRDKHRLLEPAGTDLNRLATPEKPGMWFAEGRLEHGDVFFRHPAELDPEVEFHRYFTRDIPLRIPGPVGSVSIGRLRDIYRRGAFDVLPKFLALCPPLPPTASLPISIEPFAT